MDEATSTELSSDEGPLWKYVTKLEKPARSTSKSGGNTRLGVTIVMELLWDRILRLRLIY